MKLKAGDLLIEKDNSYALLLEREYSLGVGAWRVFWDNGKKDLFPWVETSIVYEIKQGNLKHVRANEK